MADEKNPTSPPTPTPSLGMDAPPPPPAPAQPSTPPPSITPQPTDQPSTAPPSLSPEQPASTASTENAPPVEQSPQEPDVVTPKGGGSKFKIIVVIVIILIVVVYAVVAYLYFGNESLKSEVADTQTDTLTAITPEPLPEIKKADFVIVNGNVYRTSQVGEDVLLVGKEAYPNVGIGGFAFVEVSDDLSKMCFVSLPPAIAPSLYYSDTDGSGVVLASEGKKLCTWSNSGNKLAYVNDAAADAAVDIYVYDTISSEETNLTIPATPLATFRRYEIDGWSADDGTIACNYQVVDPNDPSVEVVGSCEINVATAVVTDL